MRNLVYLKVSKGLVQARSFGALRETELVCDALGHPKTMAYDFSAIANCFKKALESQPKKYWGLLKPNVLIHLLPKMEGGYTDVELRFFREAAAEAGSAQTYLLAGDYGPLSDEQLRSVVHAL